MNSSTGDIFLHSALDREKEPAYSLEVVAVDIGKLDTMISMCRRRSHILVEAVLNGGPMHRRLNIE